MIGVGGTGIGSQKKISGRNMWVNAWRMNLVLKMDLGGVGPRGHMYRLAKENTRLKHGGLTNSLRTISHWCFWLWYHLLPSHA